MEGVVIKTTGKHYTIKISNGNFIQARLKGNFRIKDIKSTNPIVVGDKVKLIQESKIWIINELYDRKNYIVRKSVNLSKQKHILAANIDQAMLMVTLQEPITTTGFIDRFLVSAKSFGVEVVIIFNKRDIYNKQILDQEKYLSELYMKIGYTCICLSIMNDDITIIKRVMKNKVNLISGHSGVGKSTLINKLNIKLDLETNEVSELHKQGKHTTTFSELHSLPFGGSVIDTPGIKGFGLIDIDKKDIVNYFIEFTSLKQGCRFKNCIHMNEPDCRVKLALKDGEINEGRYKNYIAMLKGDKGYR